MSQIQRRKGLYIAFFVLSSIITTICIASKYQTCKVTDLQTVNPVLKSYSALTMGMACKKALTMCSYYSSNPAKCVVLK